MPGEGAERCQEVEKAGPGPNRKPGRQLQAGRDTVASSHRTEQKTQPELRQRVWGHGGEGQVACPIQVKL